MFRAFRKAMAAGGFLTTLARDTRGNALAIMAATLIPLAGMVGGGVDISRMYILKTRLQHGCDAGALAGRKAMGGGTWSYNNYYSRTQAELFFDANFQTGSFASTNLSRAFTENAGKVTGTASAVIPMTLMKIFGFMTDTIAVTCEAEMRLPNTDVMFVLDTTGSMGLPQPGDTVTKIDALKTAVKCFYEIVARLNTDATCTTGSPSGGTGTQVQIRFGFVPYATNVNVGKLLPPAWFADSWNYQTRKANLVNDPNNWSWVARAGQPTTLQTEHLIQTNVPQASCNDASAAAAGYNSSTDTYSNNNTVKTNLNKTVKITGWANTSGGTCSGDRPWLQTIYDKVYGQSFQSWTYDSLPVNVSLLKNGTQWNNSFQWPINSGGSNRTIYWGGCIEERQTTSQSNYQPIPSAAKDLDIDTTPGAGSTNVSTQWGMVLPDLIYTRSNNGSWTTNSVTTPNDLGSDEYYACPVEAKKMQTWPDANEFDDYVNQLTPNGNTYHDIGLIWGARLMSPTGIFKTENQYTPQGGEIERHLIFMTDGDACTGIDNYTAYGVNWFDRRTVGNGTTPTDGCTSTGNLTTQVNVRTEALCTAIKNKNITLWVIAFGDLATSTETRLSNCASSGRYFKATNAAQLQQTFKTIADQISMLRLTT